MDPLPTGGRWASPGLPLRARPRRVRAVSGRVRTHPGSALAASGRARALSALALLATLVAAGRCDPTPGRAGVGDCDPAPADRVTAPDTRAAEGLWLAEVGRAPYSRSVVDLLRHADAPTRARAALAAGRLGGPELRRAARERLSDESSLVRHAACVAAALADDQAAEEPLLFRAATDPDAGVRLAAVRALGLLGGTPTAHALRSLARDAGAPEELRRQALRSLALLARRGARSVRPALADALAILEQGRTYPPPTPARRPRPAAAPPGGAPSTGAPPRGSGAPPKGVPRSGAASAPASPASAKPPLPPRLRARRPLCPGARRPLRPPPTRIGGRRRTCSPPSWIAGPGLAAAFRAPYGAPSPARASRRRTRRFGTPSPGPP